MFEERAPVWKKIRWLQVVWVENFSRSWRYTYQYSNGGRPMTRNRYELKALWTETWNCVCQNIKLLLMWGRQATKESIHASNCAVQQNRKHSAWRRLPNKKLAACCTVCNIWRRKLSVQLHTWSCIKLHNKGPHFVRGVMGRCVSPDIKESLVQIQR